MKQDPYNHKEHWENWKEKTQSIPELSAYNSNILLQYLYDMEKGINIADTTKNGSRSPTRLNTLRVKLVHLFKKIEERYKLEKITDLKIIWLLQF